MTSLSRIFLRRGAPLRNDVTDRRGKQILKANTKKKASSQGEGGAHPLHPPPRSAPVLYCQTSSQQATLDISTFQHGSEAFGSKLQIFKVPFVFQFPKGPRMQENNTKYRRLSRKPRSHVRILIYRTWPTDKSSR